MLAAEVRIVAGRLVGGLPDARAVAPARDAAPGAADPARVPARAPADLARPTQSRASSRSGRCSRRCRWPRSSRATGCCSFLGIGGAALIALLIAPLLLPAAERPSRRSRAAARGRLWLHRAPPRDLAAVAAVARARAARRRAHARRGRSLAIGYRPSLRDQTLVLINPPLDAFAGFLPPTRVAQGLPAPRAVRWLATGTSDVTCRSRRRVHARRAPGDGFLSLPSEQHAARSAATACRSAIAIRFSDLTIDITALDADRRPAGILARFARPLEDPGYRFMDWQGRGFVPFDLPKPAESRTLARVDFTQLLP